MNSKEITYMIIFFIEGCTKNSKAKRKRQNTICKRKPDGNYEKRKWNTISQKCKAATKRKKRSEKIIFHKFGIKNIGNTCFANLLLQILLDCKIFIENFYDSFTQKNLEVNTMSYKFYEIC